MRELEIVVMLSPDRLGRLIQHNESPVWHQPALLEVVRREQAGLASPDDDDVSDLSDDAEYLITRLSEDHGFEPVVLM
jgi:hypothetical protein